MSRKTVAVVARTSIDTAKNTLHLIGLGDNGAIVLREKVSRGQIAARLTNVPQCLIGIEAARRRVIAASNSHHVRLRGLLFESRGRCERVRRRLLDDDAPAISFERRG